MRNRFRNRPPLPPETESSRNAEEERRRPPETESSRNAEEGRRLSPETESSRNAEEERQLPADNTLPPETTHVPEEAPLQPDSYDHARYFGEDSARREEIPPSAQRSSTFRFLKHGIPNLPDEYSGVLENIPEMQLPDEAGNYELSAFRGYASTLPEPRNSPSAAEASGTDLKTILDSLRELNALAERSTTAIENSARILTELETLPDQLSFQ